MTIRVLIVDDSHLFRLGLSALISAQEGFTVVAHSRSGKEAVQTSLSAAPDVVLIDIALPGVNGLEVVPHIKRRQPNAKVVMLTNFRTEDYVRAALRAGADGYVLKDASFDELIMALRSVASGKTYLSPDVSCHVVQSFLHPGSTSTKSSPLEVLTHRERSILQLIAEGRTNRSAAEYLSVSPKTIEKHRARLMRKLGLRNASELLLAAMEMGMVERPGTVSRLVGRSYA